MSQRKNVIVITIAVVIVLILSLFAAHAYQNSQNDLAASRLAASRNAKVAQAQKENELIAKESTIVEAKQRLVNVCTYLKTVAPKAATPAECK